MSCPGSPTRTGTSPVVGRPDPLIVGPAPLLHETGERN